MNLEDIKISIFKDLQSYESKAVDLNTVLWWIKNDQSVIQKTGLYRNLAKTITREEANKKVKNSIMPAFSVAVLFNGLGKQTTHVTRITGLSICDIDHVEPSKMDDVRSKIFADPHTVLAYTTISGEGFRVIFCYADEQSSSPENGILYRAAYRKGNAYYAQLCGVDYDGQCSDITRLSGIAHDPEAMLNLDAEPFLISSDEAAAANTAADTEPGKRRKEDPTGTHHAEVEAAWTVIEQMLTKRNIAYGQGTHHHYVMHAVHLFNHFGVRKEDVLEWAAQNWCDYEQKQRESIIHWVYQNRQYEHGRWRLNKAGRPKEVAMITLPDIVKWLSENKVEVVYNQITDQTLYRSELLNLSGQTSGLSPSTSAWLQMEDSVICTIRKLIAIDTGKRVLKSDVKDMIMSDYARRIHPVRDYVRQLPEWDKADRVAQLAAHVHVSPVQDNQTPKNARELFLWALHKWLVATMADWLSDDICNETILTLIGPQGIYKTTFFRYLLPPSLRSYYLENSSNSFSQKDDQIALVENCLVEIEEIDMFKDRDNAELKSLSTKVTLKVRRPYEKFVMVKHRLASLCATGNQERFLTDETGNRRWLCFHVDNIDDPRTWDFNYEQLYAQLRDEYYDGFSYWFSKSEEERMKQQNEYFRVVSDEEQLIRYRFRKPKPGEPFKRLNAATIAQMLSFGRQPITSRRVSLIMKAIGFHAERNSKGCYYKLYEMDTHESQCMVSNMLAQEEELQTRKTMPQETKLNFEAAEDAPF
jgi:predicted P-loop ATPase